MKQNLSDQSNQDYLKLEQLEDLLDSVELQFQKTVTLLQLGTDVDTAFEGTLSAIKSTEEVATSLQGEEIRSLVSESIKLVTERMKEVIGQYKPSALEESY